MQINNVKVQILKGVYFFLKKSRLSKTILKR